MEKTIGVMCFYWLYLALCDATKPNTTNHRSRNLINGYVRMLSERILYFFRGDFFAPFFFCFFVCLFVLLCFFLHCVMPFLILV